VKQAVVEISRVRLGLGIASLFGVLWLLVLQVDRVAPGPLAPTHAQVAELVGRGGCKRCHGEDERDMAASCNECHEEVGKQLRDGSGFHGQLAAVEVAECGTCHQEHLSGAFPLVSTLSFRNAGFPTREAYDHAELDFELRGRHAALVCRDCHANADLAVLPEDEPRFLGLDQSCKACHEDAHEGRIVRDCAACHGQEHPFALVASFEHASFESECAHAAATCVQCHPRGSLQDVELLASADPPACRRTCQDCHQSSHGADFITAVAVLAGRAKGRTCEFCHSEAHSAFAGHPEAMPPGLHVASGFSLEAPHNAVACSGCHMGVEGDELVPFVLQVPARQAGDCAACHGDPHAGQFAAGPFAEATCLSCHERLAFEPSDFGLEEHLRTEFPLEASHEAVACSQCHEVEHPGEPRRFRGTEATCESCHADAHQGAFAPAAELPEEASAGCAHCHRPTLFSEYEAEAFEHGAWTGFVLDGAHERAECEACHERSARPDEAGRTFGVIAALFGEGTEDCETCHADPHDGRFDRPGLPETVADRDGCARCHTSEDFVTLHDEPFEHERWTGYPMAPFHADVECAKCHEPAPLPDQFGRTFGRALTACADCHADPHVGQFVVEGVTDCTRCHMDAGGLAFDHQRDSRYALDEIHAPLACAACHVPWPLPDGGQAVRYKPLGTKCVDCHDPDFVERNKGKFPRRPKERDLSPRGVGR